MVEGKGEEDVNLADQISVAVRAEATRHGSTQGTCAGLYAFAIGAAAGADADYWGPINKAISQAFGMKGLIRVKEMAWKINDHAGKALKEAASTMS